MPAAGHPSRSHRSRSSNYSKGSRPSSKNSNVADRVAALKRLHGLLQRLSTNRLLVLVGVIEMFAKS